MSPYIYGISGIVFILIAFGCYSKARQYQATNTTLTFASILAFIIGVGLIITPLFRN